MDNYIETRESTMRDYMRVLFRQKAVIFLTIAVILGATYIGLKLKTPLYESQVKLLIQAEKQLESPYYREVMSTRSLEQSLTQSEVIKSSPVIERAVQTLALYEQPLDYEKKFSSPLRGRIVDWQVERFKKTLSQYPAEAQKLYIYQTRVADLRDRIKVEPVRDTNIFVLKVSDFSPVGSAILANVISRSYVIFDLEQQLAELQLKYGEKNQVIAQIKDSIEKMSKTLNGQPIPATEALGPASVKIIEQASVPIRAAGLPKWVIGVLAVVMSIFVALMLAFLFEYMDQTFKTPEDIERFLNLPLLGFLPKRGFAENPIVKNMNQKSLYVHCYGNLSDQIYLILKEKKIKSVLVTAALAGEGASTVLTNLALYASQKAHHKVLLIDANFRHSTIEKMAGIGAGPGLGEVLEGKVTLDKAVKEIGNGYGILAAGKTELNPVLLLDSHAFAEVIKKAKEKYEMVLVDCANLNDYRDALAVSAHVEGVAVVIKEGKTRRQVVKNAIAPLTEKKANLIGVILNKRVFSIPGFIYQSV